MLEAEKDMRHVLCGAVMCCAVRDVCWRREIVLHAPEMLEGMRRVQLCMLEVVEGELCLLEVPEVMRCLLLCLGRLWRVRSVRGRCWR